MMIAVGVMIVSAVMIGSAGMTEVALMIVVARMIVDGRHNVDSGSGLFVMTRVIRMPRVDRAEVATSRIVRHAIPAGATRSSGSRALRAKEQMQRAIMNELGLTKQPEPHDVSDALAAALCHYYVQKTPA